MSDYSHSPPAAGFQASVGAQAADETFEAIYDAYKVAIYRYVLARVGDDDDAHDLTAQVFLAALKHAASYRRETPVLGWLVGIARHHVAHYFRRRRSHLSFDTLPDVPGVGLTVEEVVEKRLRLRRVAAALNSLSEDRREAISLRIFAGLTNGQIAEVMDRSADAVAMLVYRGLQDLKQRLGSGEEDVSP